MFQELDGMGVVKAVPLFKQLIERLKPTIADRFLTGGGSA